MLAPHLLWFLHPTLESPKPNTIPPEGHAFLSNDQTKYGGGLQDDVIKTTAFFFFFGTHLTSLLKKLVQLI